MTDPRSVAEHILRCRRSPRVRTLKLWAEDVFGLLVVGVRSALRYAPALEGRAADAAFMLEQTRTLYPHLVQRERTLLAEIIESACDNSNNRKYAQQRGEWLRLAARMRLEDQ